MENSQYKELFLSESQELLNALNQVLIKLEKTPSSREFLDETFRHCHTLKGMAATMGYDRLVHLAHAMENVLAKAREDKLKLGKQVLASLYEGSDFLQIMIQAIMQDEEVTINEIPLLLQLEMLVDEKTQEAKVKVEVKKEQPEAKVKTKGPVIQSVRVNLERLDVLMNTVGELHINKICLSEVAKNINKVHLTEAVKQLERIADKLQDEMMQVRLLPLKYLLTYFPRMVRDCANQEGKIVNLNLVGEEIGVDRTILDEINDPLIHILRNAVSHGIESPEERRLVGKSAEGHIQITALREQDFVVLKISDDGRGLDKVKIGERIVKQGILSKEELEKMDEEEIFKLITLPNFSLSEEITERSGRGVGMNVVRSKVKNIAGSLSIQSQLGKGTTFILRLPITMAIVHSMLVQFCNETCAIPIHFVLETLRIETSLIKRVAEQEVIAYRDEILPLIRLSTRLGFVATDAPTTLLSNLPVVVCEVERKRIGIVVDKLVGQQDLVIKNLTGLLHSLTHYSGVTILGTGKVAMIIDVAALMNEEIGL